MLATEHHTSIIAKSAAFVVGLSTFQPIYLCISGSSFAMKHFGYGDEAVAVFVPLTMNAMEILFTVAVLSAALMMPAFKYAGRAYFLYICSGMSMVSVSVPVVTNVLLLRIYLLDNDINNVTRYYWLLVLSHLTSGIGMSLSFVITADESFYFESGTCFIGLSVACFQWVIIKILECCGLDVGCWMIVCQLIFMLGLSTVAAALWFWYLIQDKVVHASADTSSGKGDDVSILGFAKSLPMVLGVIIAQSALLSAFPVILPFEMVHVRYYYPILRLTMFMETVGGLALLLLGRCTGATTKDWYTGTNAWWHLIWLSYIPYLGIAYMCITSMHYPESFAAKIVLSNPIVAGVLTVVYYGMGRFIFGLTGVAISANSNGYGEVIVPSALGIRQASMNILKYMSEAHVQQFKLAKEGVKAGKAWPTDGMSKYSAVRYWIRIAAKTGYSNFREMASADVKKRLGGVRGRIVNYHTVASTVE